jgi:hypothetical protein
MSQPYSFAAAFVAAAHRFAERGDTAVEATDADLAAHDRVALSQVQGDWCLTETCFHRAPAPGSRCPTCQEEYAI